MVRSYVFAQSSSVDRKEAELRRHHRQHHKWDQHRTRRETVSKKTNFVSGMDNNTTDSRNSYCLSADTTETSITTVSSDLSDDCEYFAHAIASGGVGSANATFRLAGTSDVVTCPSESIEDSHHILQDNKMPMATCTMRRQRSQWADVVGGFVARNRSCATSHRSHTSIAESRFFFSRSLFGLLCFLALIQPLMLSLKTDQIFFTASRRFMTSSMMEDVVPSAPSGGGDRLSTLRDDGASSSSSSLIDNLPRRLIRGENRTTEEDNREHEDTKRPGPILSLRTAVTNGTATSLTIVDHATRGTTTNPALNADDDYPDDKERVVFLISMGSNAVKSRIVERFVYSARSRGKYNDWIVVLSDAPNDRYKELSEWTSKLIHIQPDPAHLNPPSHNFTLPSMGYKRLKTYVLEYVATDHRLDNVELIYYLDVDIVFGDSIWPMFHGLESKYGILNGTSPVTSTEKFKAAQPKGRVWMFHGNTPKWKIQGGQMFLHRHHSQPCLERWRYLIDTWSRHARKDQDMLMWMLQDQTNAIDNEDLSQLECEIVIMKQKPFIEFPEPRAIVRRAKQIRKDFESAQNQTALGAESLPAVTHYYSPLVHLRNDGGTKRVQPGNIKVYIQDVLKFEDGQKDELGVLKKMVM